MPPSRPDSSPGYGEGVDRESEREWESVVRFKCVIANDNVKYSRYGHPRNHRQLLACTDGLSFPGIGNVFPPSHVGVEPFPFGRDGREPENCPGEKLQYCPAVSKFRKERYA